MPQIRARTQSVMRGDPPAIAPAAPPAITRTRSRFMSPQTATPADATLAILGDLLPGLEKLYKDVHSHPELSMRETRTARIAADRLKAAGFEVTTGVGKTGVVGVLRNG